MSQLHKETWCQPGVTQALNPSTGEAEAGCFLWVSGQPGTWEVPGQLGKRGDPDSQKKKCKTKPIFNYHTSIAKLQLAVLTGYNTLCGVNWDDSKHLEYLSYHIIDRPFYLAEMFVMDPWRGAVLVEEAQAVPMVVAMDLEVEVVDMVAEGFKIKQKRLQFLAGERARSCQESCRLLWDSRPKCIRGTVKICHRRNDDP